MALDNGSAWIGFTAASGTVYENHDILSWTFFTHPIPFVISTTPVNGGNISVSGDIEIYFSEEIDLSSVDAASLIVTNSAGTAVSYSDSKNGQTLILDPDSDLASSEVYTVTITTNVLSTGGYGLLEPYTFTFTAGTRILYVDNVSGDNANSGLTPLHALRTVQYAASILNTNEPAIVYVKDTGTAYNGTVLGVTNLYGQDSKNPIRFISYDGSAVLSGGADTVLLEGCKYVEISGFTIQNASTAGIHLWACTNVVIKNNTFLNNTGSDGGIRFERQGLADEFGNRPWGVPSTEITISKNIFYNNSPGIYFNMQAEPANFYLRNNSWTKNSTIIGGRGQTIIFYNDISYGNSGSYNNSQSYIELHDTMMSDCPTSPDSTYEVVDNNVTDNPQWINGNSIDGLHLQSNS
ncbi:MAG TPA: Ig-like domain-containing protein, partial [Spirochaetota bacterium]|nr:Ig-like domain-containing protein [Spirochaetota bacterium]